VALRFPIVPMKAALGSLPPSSQDGEWAYEIKWDGYRTLAFIDDGSAAPAEQQQPRRDGEVPRAGGLAGRGERTRPPSSTASWSCSMRRAGPTSG
jgi:hypothetical protein